MGAQGTSLAQSLTDLYPALYYIVQMSDPASTNRNRLNSPPPKQKDKSDQEIKLSPRISVTTRISGTRQTITNASLYILRLSSLCRTEILTELQMCFGALRLSNCVMLILTTHLLPEPGSTPDTEIEATARSRDLTLLQLTNEGEMEMAELLEMIEAAGDSMGKLEVINKLSSRNSLVLALVVKYQPGG